jgi:hypothetical protein
MQVHQALDQMQADAQATLGTVHFRLDLGEHVEYRTDILGGQPHAIVADADEDIFAIHARSDADEPASWRVLGRIVEDVAHHLHHAMGIGLQVEVAFGGLQLQLVTVLLDQRHADFDSAGQRRLDRHVLLPQLDLALGDAGDVEQVFDQVRQVADLAIHHLVDVVLAFAAGADELHDFQPVADRRQRIAQLVRQGHQEFALAAVDGSQVLRQQLQVALGFAFLMHVHDGTDEAARQVVPGRQGRARIDHQR